MMKKKNSIDFFKNNDENHCVRQDQFYPTFATGSRGVQVRQYACD